MLIEEDRGDEALKKITQLANFQKSADLQRLAGVETISNATLDSLNTQLITELQVINRSKLAEGDKELAREEAFKKYNAAITAAGTLAAKESYNERVQIQLTEIAKLAAISNTYNAGVTSALLLESAELSMIDRIAKAQAEADAKRAIQMATLDTASNGIALLSKLFENNKAVQKAALLADSAIGIAKIIINTQAANAGAIAKYSLIPGGLALAAKEITLNKINAGLGIAANVLATAKGLKGLGGGSTQSASVGGGSGGSGGSSTAASVTPSAPQFNVVGTSGQNQIAQSLGNQAPVKAFVVSNDVTTAQSLDRNIVRTATLGD
jgi:hypothetical protein